MLHTNLFHHQPQIRHHDLRNFIFYPNITRDDKIVENRFGTPVHDPFRWLEEMNNSKVKEFVAAQNRLTDAYLKNSGGDIWIRDRIRSRLIDLWTYSDYNCPFKRGNRYFYIREGYMSK